MTTNSYRIFITKSAEAARLIADALGNDGSNPNATMRGDTTYFNELPEIYRENGLFCAIAEYRDGKRHYEITIC